MRFGYGLWCFMPLSPIGLGVGRGGCAFWLWVMVFYATFTNWVRGRERWRCDRGRERWMCILVMGYGVLCHFHQLG